ncbi:MAG: GNAT family N-acetyltransferase [Actinobacteria bacterium]|nr:GNAT family N-acetyltransferase [Actinomycetota bacterium]
MTARLVRPDEHSAATAVIGSAFAQDPAFVWIFDDDTTRPALVNFFMSLVVKSSAASGQCYVTPDLGAAALWAAPGRDFSAGSTGQLIGALIFGAQPVRAAEIGAFFGEVRNCRPAEPHWYLSLIGASRPGSGAGAKVIEPVLRTCDTTGELAYLESSNPRNIGFYERLGFEPTAELRPDSQGPLLTTMVRQPN